MPARSRPTRLETALIIRDQALPFIRTHGKVTRFGIPPRDTGSVKAICGKFRLDLGSPFNRAELLRRWGEESYARALQRQISRDLSRLPWTLDIWPDRRMAGGHWVYGHKVLNLHWYDAGAAELITFRPGSWPGELLAALTAASLS
jgi:hypothetical protein